MSKQMYFSVCYLNWFTNSGLLQCLHWSNMWFRRRVISLSNSPTHVSIYTTRKVSIYITHTTWGIIALCAFLLFLAMFVAYIYRDDTSDVLLQSHRLSVLPVDIQDEVSPSRLIVRRKDIWADALQFFKNGLNHLKVTFIGEPAADQG